MPIPTDPKQTLEEVIITSQSRWHIDRPQGVTYNQFMAERIREWFSDFPNEKEVMAAMDAETSIIERNGGYDEDDPTYESMMEALKVAMSIRLEKKHG